MTTPTPLLPPEERSSTKSEILAQLKAMVSVPAQADDEVTIREFYDVGGAETIETATRRLDQLVDQGVCSKRLVQSTANGRRCWAYRFVNRFVIGAQNEF